MRGLIYWGLITWALVAGAHVGRAIPASANDGSSANEAPATADNSEIVFERAIQPLLHKKCAPCHGDDGRKAELDLRSAASLFAGGESGPVVTPGEPSASLLLEKLEDGSMPPEDAEVERFTPAEVELVRRWIAAGAVSELTTSASPQEDAAAEGSYHDVLPILLRNCTACHGTQKIEAELDLRTYEGIVRGGKSGPVVVPGDPEKSLLIQRVAEREMPPLNKLIEFTVKPIEAHELESLRRWIAMGAPKGNVQPDVATTSPDPLVSDADRAFWSFQPPRQSPVPACAGNAKIRNPVDAFIHAELAARGLTFAEEASRATLLRRLSFDLTGLPPTPEETTAFLADDAPDAYERTVERLLASPRYGEHWARMWLDVAGYADSDGKREQDLERRFAWRYRDYVIGAFNSDAPYDRFLLEQLAGDELVDYESAAEFTDEIYNSLVATGFLRMAPDPTWASVTNFIPDRLDIIADEIDVLGSAVLGLTLKCARCHSHKFDPLPQRDYYRLAAIFKGAFDEYDWLKGNWDTSISKGLRLERALPCKRAAEQEPYQARLAEFEAQCAALEEKIAQRTSEVAEKVRNERLAAFPAEVQEELRAALATSPEKRSPSQTELAARHADDLTLSADQLRELDAEFDKYYAAADLELRGLKKRRPDAPFIHALWDRGSPSPTYIYRRGDYLSPGRLVGPGVPSALTDGRTPFVVEPPRPGAKSTGRRLALARWLIQPDHPLTARVFVNRVWRRHFGAGIVRTLDNFGSTGARPSHPALLDWLARDFVDHGWSVKRLHRTLVTSQTYRQSSHASPGALQADPDNVYLSRMPLQRLTADQLYDAMLAMADALDLRPGGPPDRAEVQSNGVTMPVRGPRGWRRSIYLQQQRKVVVTQLEAFDFPAMNPNCSERGNSTVAPQALFLWNNRHVEEMAEQFAERMVRAGATPADQAAWALLAALGRRADDAELADDVAALQELETAWRLAGAPTDDERPTNEPRASEPPTNAPTASEPANDAAQRTAPIRARATWCHALLNSAEFLYVD